MVFEGALLLDLTNLQASSGTECLIIEKVFCFLLCLDLKGLRFLRICAENIDEIFEFPLVDVIIGRIHAMDVSLNGVAFVADDESKVVSSVLRQLIQR